MKKRFLAMVLAAAMMLTAMVGCGNGNTQDGGNANNAGARVIRLKSAAFPDWRCRLWRGG
ncbi:MAG: hypothetical protein ACLS8R_05190 [Anaeromassilibacillus sp.]